MANLRDRLKRIKEINKNSTPAAVQTEAVEKLLSDDWKVCGFNVIKREVKTSLMFNFSKLHNSISIIIPDIFNCEHIKPGNFIFFDLETTGLGGSGTAAFLASFGRLNKEKKLVITQYLLLDYPGEVDFLNSLTAELEKENAMIVTYNGKSFDCQIVKSRCLINRLKTPLFKHADLLHPARRLWKSIIHDCSQSSVERQILGINRIDDIPGSLAPEIWFDFLKTGNTERLKGICSHNIYDIEGLASIFEAMIKIADDFETDLINYDRKRAALSFYKYAYYKMKAGNYEEPLKLIDVFIELLPEGSFWQVKLGRRKARLIKLAGK